jgi:hypothetical protein
MSAITFRHPAQSGSYRSFRDEAVSRQVRRLRRKDLSRRKRNAFVAAGARGCRVVVHCGGFAVHVGCQQGCSRNPACLEAGQRLAPWFKAETDRKVQVGLNKRDDFNILVTWFRNAQSQCASGMTARAVENFHAIESMIAERVEQQQPQPEGE